MLVTNTMEATAPTTDSCQVSEPVTATQETPRTIATYTATTPAMHRKSFKSSKNRLFFPLQVRRCLYCCPDYQPHHQDEKNSPLTQPYGHPPRTKRTI